MKKSISSLRNIWNTHAESDKKAGNESIGSLTGANER